MRKLLEKFRRGFDFWALVLYAALLLPYLVYWCLPQLSGIPRGGALTVAAQIFEALSMLLLVFLVRTDREKKKLLFDSSFPTMSILLFLYYAAWMILYFGKVNFAVGLFVMLVPSLSLGLFAAERKNYLAFLPVAVSAILQIISLISQNLAL